MSLSIVLVGEAPGEHEITIGRPFVGAAGQELYRLLCDAGFPLPPLRRNVVSPNSMSVAWNAWPHPILNVFAARPEANNVENFYASRNEPVDTTLPVRRFGSSGKFVLQERAGDIRALRSTLLELRPNITVLLGATACWALDLGGSIGRLRGFVHDSPYGKLLPTYHPAAVLRKWPLRVPTLFDLFKARREAGFPEVRVPEREIWTEPTIDDLWKWWELYGRHSRMISLDIETLRSAQISEVGFAADPYHALHIPFRIEHRDGNCKTYQNWWPDAQTEFEAWKFVKHVCASPIPKIGQNGIEYDCYWLAKELGIVVSNYTHDTMQLAHAWLPEMGKSLYDLGAMMLDDASWKNIRRDSGKDND